MPFQIVAISHIWDDAFGDGAEGGARLPEAAWGGSVKALPGRIDLAVGTPSKTAWLAKATKAIEWVELSASLQPPRRQLTPGRSLSFRVGPLSRPLLFNAFFSYQLEVPEDATHITFPQRIRCRLGAVCHDMERTSTIRVGRVVSGSQPPEPDGQ